MTTIKSPEEKELHRLGTVRDKLFAKLKKERNPRIKQELINAIHENRVDIDYVELYGVGK